MSFCDISVVYLSDHLCTRFIVHIVQKAVINQSIEHIKFLKWIWIPKAREVIEKICSYFEKIIKVYWWSSMMMLVIHKLWMLASIHLQILQIALTTLFFWLKIVGDLQVFFVTTMNCEIVARFKAIQKRFQWIRRTSRFLKIRLSASEDFRSDLLGGLVSLPTAYRVSKVSKVLPSVNFMNYESGESADPRLSHADGVASRFGF